MCGGETTHALRQNPQTPKAGTQEGPRKSATGRSLISNGSSARLKYASPDSQCDRMTGRQRNNLFLAPARALVRGSGRDGFRPKPMTTRAVEELVERYVVNLSL